MQKFPPFAQEKSAFGRSAIWNSQQCRGRQGHPCREIQGSRKRGAGQESWAPSVPANTTHPGVYKSNPLDYNSPRKHWEILKQRTPLPYFLFVYFEENWRDDQEAEPVLEGCLRIPMAQTSPEDSNHLKTPETAKLSLVVWGEQSLSASINTLQALLAKISPWAGYFWHSAQSRAADRHCRWLSAVKSPENIVKVCKSEESGQIPASVIPSPNIPAAVAIGKPSLPYLTPGLAALPLE